MHVVLARLIGLPNTRTPQYPRAISCGAGARFRVMKQESVAQRPYSHCPLHTFILLLLPNKEKKKKKIFWFGIFILQ